MECKALRNILEEFCTIKFVTFITLNTFSS
jgi:hypothetical protein